MNSDDEKYSDVEDNESIDSEPQPKKVFNKSSKNNDSDVEDNDDVVDKYEDDDVIVNDNNSDDEEVDDDDDDDDDEQQDENISSNGIAKLKGNNKQLGNTSNLTDINKNVIIDDNNLNDQDYNDDDDDDDDDDNDYLNLLEDNINSNYIEKHHPECLSHNFNEVEHMCSIVRDKDGNIIDPLHKTTPILTKYERTRILGQRCKQLNDGSKPFISLPYDIVDMHIIAEMELEQKKIPFIVKRPIPNGGFEYWRLNDLEILSF